MSTGPGAMQSRVLAAATNAHDQFPNGVGLWFDLEFLLPELDLGARSISSSIRRACGLLRDRLRIDLAYVFDESIEGLGARWKMVVRIPLSLDDENDLADSIELVSTYRVRLIKHHRIRGHLIDRCAECIAARYYVDWFEAPSASRGVYLPDDVRLAGTNRGIPGMGFYGVFSRQVHDALES